MKPYDRRVTDVLCEVDGLVATVTLNRPERRNAISGNLLTQLRATITELDASPDVRVIVLTGADPAFCAGWIYPSSARPIARWRERHPAR